MITEGQEIGDPCRSEMAADALQVAIGLLGEAMNFPDADCSAEHAERRLWLITALERTADVARYEATEVLHDRHGRSWSDIGRVVGTSRNNAWQWWQRRRKYYGPHLEAEREASVSSC